MIKHKTNVDLEVEVTMAEIPTTVCAETPVTFGAVRIARHTYTLT